MEFPWPFSKKEVKEVKGFKDAFEFVDKIEESILRFIDDDPAIIYSFDAAADAYSTSLALYLIAGARKKVRHSSLQYNPSFEKVELFTKELSEGRKNIIVSYGKDGIEEAISKKIDELSYDTLGTALITIFPEPELKVIEIEYCPGIVENFLEIAEKKVPQEIHKMNQGYVDTAIKTIATLQAAKKYGWNDEIEYYFHRVIAVDALNFNCLNPDSPFCNWWDSQWKKSRKLRGDYISEKNSTEPDIL